MGGNHQAPPDEGEQWPTHRHRGFGMYNYLDIFLFSLKLKAGFTFLYLINKVQFQWF